MFTVFSKLSCFLYNSRVPKELRVTKAAQGLQDKKERREKWAYRAHRYVCCFNALISVNAVVCLSTPQWSWRVREL